MTTPARDAAWAEQEQGAGSLPSGAQPSPSAALVEAGAVIERLRQRVQVWVDSDRVLPADGSLLLAALDRVRVGLIEEDAAARAGVEQFAGKVQALIAVGALEASDGHPPIEAAARLIAGPLSAGTTARETHRSPADASRAQNRPAAEDSLAGSGDGHPSSRSERNGER